MYDKSHLRAVVRHERDDGTGLNEFWELTSNSSDDETSVELMCYISEGEFADDGSFDSEYISVRCKFSEAPSEIRENISEILNTSVSKLDRSETQVTNSESEVVDYKVETKRVGPEKSEDSTVDGVAVSSETGTQNSSSETQVAEDFDELSDEDERDDISHGGDNDDSDTTTDADDTEEIMQEEDSDLSNPVEQLISEYIRGLSLGSDAENIITEMLIELDQSPDKAKVAAAVYATSFITGQNITLSTASNVTGVDEVVISDEYRTFLDIATEIENNSLDWSEVAA